MSIRLLSATTALVIATGALAQTAAPSTEPRPLVSHGKFVMSDGEGVYDHLCQGCHMADAQGAAGAGVYPALAGDPRLAAGAYPVMVILKGRKAMPPFGDTLDDKQIAAVVNYIRGHYGNHYSGSVTPADVKALR